MTIITMMMMMMMMVGCRHRRDGEVGTYSQPCDDYEEIHVDARREANAVVLEARVITGHCSGRSTEIRPIGRILLLQGQTPDGACPIGQRYGDYQIPQFEATLEREQKADADRAFMRFSRGTNDGYAFVLGCPSTGRADYLFVDAHSKRQSLFVNGKIVESDPRFVAAYLAP